MGAAVAGGGILVTDDPSAEVMSTDIARPVSRWLDAFGILWVLAATGVTLIPALVHGPYIGSFDLLSIYGLTAKTGVVIHNVAIGDQSNEIIPWITLAWTQVHHGHLPLWNPYEALGMPLAFDWGSGAFSLPALVSYLAPLRLAYWVQIIVSLVVGGTGAYFFPRVLRLHPIACAFAGTTWVLSGPSIGYLGLPDASVLSWAGWQFAAVVLITPRPPPAVVHHTFQRGIGLFHPRRQPSDRGGHPARPGRLCGRDASQPHCLVPRCWIDPSTGG